MERFNCKGCGVQHYATASGKNSNGSTVYLDSQGNRVTLTKCYECVKAYNRAKMATKTKREPLTEEIDDAVCLTLPSRACGKCSLATYNRYYCNSCWSGNESLSSQDTPTFTKEERQAIYNFRREND